MTNDVMDKLHDTASMKEENLTKEKKKKKPFGRKHHSKSDETFYQICHLTREEMTR